MSAASGSSKPIQLRVVNQKAYVWDVNDVAAIRSQHRLCGILTGTLPHLSQQNVFLGLPLLLMPEEAVLLVENSAYFQCDADEEALRFWAEAAVFIDDPNAHPQPTTQQLDDWDGSQQEDVKEQLSLLEAKAGAGGTGSKSMSAEAQAKRKAREEKRAAAAALAASNPDNLLTPDGPVPAPTTMSKTPEPSTKNPSNLPYTIVIPSSSSSLNWYSPESASYNSVEAAKAAGIWSYPANLHERARCGVFRDLWNQGYFLGGGIKFGGEYLVYPGDPLRYHSHFAASVIDSPISSLKPMEIVAHGRLGTATKKAHLLCSWDDEKNTVTYLTIEWSGFG